MEKMSSPYSLLSQFKGYSLVTIDSLRKQEGEVIRNLSDDSNILFFWRVASEICGEKARIKRFLLIITVKHSALQRNGQRHGGIK